MAKKTSELEQTLGFYILSVVSHETKEQENFRNILLSAATSPDKIKKFAQAAKNILNNGRFPQEKVDIIKEICLIPEVTEQLGKASSSSDVVAGLWLKWCAPTVGTAGTALASDGIASEKKAIEADLQKAKKKISRLQKENSVLEQEAGKDKLVSIVASIAPSINELAMFTSLMEKANIDADAISGYSNALQAIKDALVDAGASLIGSVGEETEFDPALHHCVNHIAKGTSVIITASGFMVDADVIVPAVVEETEV